MVKSNIDKKFSAHYDAVEAELKSSTVGMFVQQAVREKVYNLSLIFYFCIFWLGLVTLNDMKAKQEALVKEREKQLAKKEQSKELQLWVIPHLWLTVSLLLCFLTAWH